MAKGSLSGPLPREEVAAEVRRTAGRRFAETSRQVAEVREKSAKAWGSVGPRRASLVSSRDLVAPAIHVIMCSEDDAVPLVISDETLRAAGMDEPEAKVEIACRWFEAGKLAMGHAARLAGLSEAEFEAQLQLRGIPRYRYTEETLEHDVEVLKKLGRW